MVSQRLGGKSFLRLRHGRLLPRSSGRATSPASPDLLRLHQRHATYFLGELFVLISVSIAVFYASLGIEIRTSGPIRFGYPNCLRKDNTGRHDYATSVSGFYWGGPRGGVVCPETTPRTSRKGGATEITPDSVPVGCDLRWQPTNDLGTFSASSGRSCSMRCSMYREEQDALMRGAVGNKRPACIAALARKTPSSGVGSTELDGASGRVYRSRPTRYRSITKQLFGLQPLRLRSYSIHLGCLKVN